MLTITISIASGADAIFSFLPKLLGTTPALIEPWKLPVAFTAILVLTVLNIRGVKESVTSLLPIFAVFLLTHAVLLVVAIGGHLGDVGAVSTEVRENVGRTTMALGTFGALKLFVRAYSLGAAHIPASRPSPMASG